MDDNDDDRGLIEHALEIRGLKNLWRARNGREAIDFLNQSEQSAGPAPLLMLLDIAMPLKNGFEVLRWVRASARWRTLPVIMLTGAADPEDVRRAHELGCNAYVVKPGDASELMSLAGGIREFWVRHNRLAGE